MAKKLNLFPKSPRGRRTGMRFRNVTVEIEEGDRMFVRFEGWNRWMWIKKKDDPDYVVKRGWHPAGMPMSQSKGKEKD